MPSSYYFNKVNDFYAPMGKSARGVLRDQLRWLVKLRWGAVAFIIIGARLGASSTDLVIFPVLEIVTPIYYCAFALLACNILYYLLSITEKKESDHRNVLMAFIQVEVDLAMLTALLHFSGGVMNPFALFYVFHLIIATIILPLNLNFWIGLTAIILYGLMAVGEMKGWPWMDHYPLKLATSGALWKNSVYVLWAVSAFVGMVALTQYLTRSVVSRMRAKELEAAKNHDVLMAIINAMNEGLIFLTSQGDISLCNRSAISWCETERNDSHYKPEDFPEELSDHLKRLLRPAHEIETESQVIEFGSIDNGKRYIEAKSYPVSGDREGYLGHVIVGKDLTGHKKLERDLIARTDDVTKINDILRKSHLEIAHREKMAAIGQMASGIAHEIGNPLNSLSSVVQYLSRKITDPASKKQLDTISNQVNRITKILKNLLGVSRPVSNEFTWVNISQVIEATLSLIRYDKRAQHVSIEYDKNATLPTIWNNSQYLEQVLLNVFLNALDAMTDEAKFQEHTLGIRQSVANDLIEIRISDTGIGADADTLSHVFEPFYTTKGVGKGTGLGLYISRNLIGDMGGSIELLVNPDRGITVVLRLPANPAGDLMGTKTMETVKSGENN
ncbi:MAG: hypothetical protein K9M57_01175 [Phycisphaerae bacterium]|nr:hypothetical protein [Phycisphaerae bacterium]